MGPRRTERVSAAAGVALFIWIVAVVSMVSMGGMCVASVYFGRFAQ